MASTSFDQTRSIFLSHATADDGFVRELRIALESLGLPVWVDSGDLRGGDVLRPEIEQAIEQARQVIVVLSPSTVNSAWVRDEVAFARQVEERRRDHGYRVIPLLLRGIEPAALPLWFGEDRAGVTVTVQPGGLSEALPAILGALGEQAPAAPEPMQEVAAAPIEELLLHLSDLLMTLEDGERRVRAEAVLSYQPADSTARGATSKRFSFTAPLGPIEADDLRWYLERYYQWPVGVFRERARRIEAQLPQWGQALYRSVTRTDTARQALAAWQQTADESERRFSVLVDADPGEEASGEAQAAAQEVASALLALPWGLLHDGTDYLFSGARPVRVRRRLPDRRAQKRLPAGLPIRILLVSPRPEDESTAYIDHRVSARPLLEAVEDLGDLAELHVLGPPTFPAMEQALRDAGRAGRPFDVVHFDGHGVYDREHGLGGLCFERPQDVDRLHKRRMELVQADRLAGMMRDFRIPLVFLEACQSAQSEQDPTASVAARLLDEGVSSVVAMSHSVLVETARRFVAAFYQELARGSRVGQAMLAGQTALSRDTFRMPIPGAGELHLQDWFVPVLFQERHDPQLFTHLLPATARRLQEKTRRLSLGRLPAPPPHDFIGRSRELLALERLLRDRSRRWAVVRGQGGAGKTTLAVEQARWLVRSARCERAAFVSVEQVSDVRAVVDSLGRQLLPEGDAWSVAQFPELKKALQPLERTLAERRSLIVIDNLESVLPDRTGQAPLAAAPFEELFDLCRTLLQAGDGTRIIFTSREPLPAPFDRRDREVVLGALSRDDAIELVSRVMTDQGLAPSSSDPGSTPQEIIDLVEVVGCHARALVLLAREVSRQGVRATTQDLHRLMAELHRRHPDERERSLYASVELSLRRLSAEARQQVRALAVFHGGAQINVLAQVLGVEAEVTRSLAIELIEVGLGEDMGYGHLRLDPALAPFLFEEMAEAERSQLTVAWAAAMQGLTAFLVRQRFKDTKLAAQLTLLELPNLLALLECLRETAPLEEVADFARALEDLLAHLSRPRALARAVAAREQATRSMGGWSRSLCMSEVNSIERLLEHGDLRAAYATTDKLLKRCLAEGEDAYTGAAYDIAAVHRLMGRVLKEGGAAEAALAPLAEARERFKNLADAGNTSAEHMGSIVLTDSAECFCLLGQLDMAVAAFEEAIQCAEEIENLRQAALGKGHLGTVRMLQRRYTNALALYHEAREVFENLGEPASVATLWHQIGMVHRSAGQFDEAERSHRQSLAIRVREKNRAGEASSLCELGNLYNQMDRFEEAVTFYRQAAEISSELDNMSREGLARNNLADTLIKLRRYDEARREIRRAIECKEQFGHAAEPWMTWGILYDLETATGNPDAAADARQKAIRSFLAYRRDGGENQNTSARLCDLVAHAIRSHDLAAAKQQLDRFSGPDAGLWARDMVPKLRAILDGERNPTVAEDPALHFTHAVELQLLLEHLQQE